MSDISRFVPNVHFEQIPIKNLVSNQDYQRNLSLFQINKAAANFDLYQINPVKVSRRGGVNYVFNGQHTIEIVAQVSGSRDTPVWCMIYDDLDYTDEADIFANQMKFVRPLSPYEIFMAHVEAGNDRQLMIKGLIESFGLKLGNAKTHGTICAVGAVEYIYERYGFHVLSDTLKLIIATWEGEDQSFSANVLKSVAMLITIYGDLFDEEVFKERLSSISIKQLIRMAKERRPGVLGYCEAMVIEYNGKRKAMSSRLPIRRLYEKDAVLIDCYPDKGLDDDTLTEEDDDDTVDVTPDEE